MMIRRAEAKDIDAIKNLLEQVLLVHHNGRPDIFKPDSRKYKDDELVEIMKDDSSPIFVAEIENTVKGYAFCIINEIKDNNILHDSKSIYIDDLCVDENARGTNIGKSLYEYVKEYAKSIGCSSITLNVWECNPGAKRFYEKMGMIPMKTVMECTLTNDK